MTKTPRRRTTLIVLAVVAAVLALGAVVLVAVAVLGSDSGDESPSAPSEAAQSVPVEETPEGVAWLTSVQALDQRAEQLEARMAEAEASADMALMFDLTRELSALTDEYLQTPPPDPEMAALWQQMWSETKSGLESLLEFFDTADPQALDDFEEHMAAADAAAQEWEQRFDVAISLPTEGLEDDTAA